MTKENQIIELVCKRFNVPHGRFLLEIASRSPKYMLIKKWSAFFIKKHTRRSYEDIGSVVRLKRKECMDSVGEVGFKIRSEPQYEIDLNAMNIHMSKIYQNESN